MRAFATAFDFRDFTTTDIHSRSIPNFIRQIKEDTEWQTKKEPASIHIRAQKSLSRTVKASREKKEKLKVNPGRSRETSRAAHPVIVRNAPRVAQAKAALPRKVVT